MRNLPPNCQDFELVNLVAPVGVVERVLVLQNSSQGFLQMKVRSKFGDLAFILNHCSVT
jgi:hypothetical protein